MDEKKKLQKQIGEARARLDDIEDADRRALNATLVGRCFQYRNSYGGGSSWWLYQRVTGLNKDGYPVGYQFQDDGQGKLDVETEKWRLHLGDREISAKAFNAAWDKFVSAIIAVRE